MTEPYEPNIPVNPELVTALDNISRSVNDFTAESRNLRDSVIAGTVQRIRYSRYGALFAGLATALVIVSMVLSGFTLKTLLDARSSRNAQAAASTQNQSKIISMLEGQQAQLDQIRQNALRGAVVSSYCATSYDTIPLVQACLTRNGVPAPDLK